MRCAVAIRYLCGILELPTFWQETYYEDHCPIADKLIKRTVKVLEDIGVSPHSIDVKYPIPEDTEGIDRLVCATLTGVQTWQRQMDNEKLQSGCWFSDFQKLLTVILWYVSFVSRFLAELTLDIILKVRIERPNAKVPSDCMWITGIV